MRSNATSIEEYLEELPEDRRKAISSVRDAIIASLPEGFEETMDWGMIAYQVPLARCADTYNGKPLMYAALASQKNHMAVYLSAIYADDERRKRFEDAYRATGKRLNVGKSCVRFKKLEDLPVPLICEMIGSMTADEFIEIYKRGRARVKK